MKKISNQRAAPLQQTFEQQIDAKAHEKADGRVYKKAAQELVKGWSAKKLSEEDGAKLRQSIEKNDGIFTRDAKALAKEFVNVTLPKLIVSDSFAVGLPASTAVLSWTAPTTNTDGSALTDLVGYRVIYGTSANSLTKMVNVRDAHATRLQIPNLPSGTWYFAVKALSPAAESDPSNIVSKAIP